MVAKRIPSKEKREESFFDELQKLLRKYRPGNYQAFLYSDGRVVIWKKIVVKGGR